MELFGRTVEYKRISDWGYQVTVSEGSRTRTIPLILEEKDVRLSKKMLGDLQRVNCGFDLFSDIVTGAIAISMKYGSR